MNKKLIIILGATLIFFPALFNFFSADDWFHLYLSQINRPNEFLNFFSFTANEQSAAFYRPIPTQLFFFVFRSLFSLNAIPYYFFVFVTFALSLFLVHKLAFLLTKSTRQALIITLIYGFSATNFSRIYFLSAFQEIVLVVFSLLAFINFLEKKAKLSYLFFILALMSKETAVVVPFLFLAYQWLVVKKVKWSHFLPYFLILLEYLYLRLMVFGLAEGDTYIWNFSPKTTINTLMWYILWTFGAPELLVDYVGSGFKIIPRFFTDYPQYSPILLIGLLASLFIFGLNLITQFKKLNHLFFFACFWFLISLLPVIFLPSHKFALELGLPLFGFALALSQILGRRFLSTLFLITYLVFNLAMNHLIYTRHYSTRRAVLSRRVYDYVLKNHYPCPQNDFLFYNSGKIDYAKEVKLTISGPNMLKVICEDKNTNTYFSEPVNSKQTIIPSDIFFPI